MAAILMPSAFFIEVARAAIESLFSSAQIPDGQEWRVAARLAPLLGVSKQAATIRLNTLKIAAPPGQKRLF